MTAIALLDDEKWINSNQVNRLMEMFSYPESIKLVAIQLKEFGDYEYTVKRDENLKFSLKLVR